MRSFDSFTAEEMAAAGSMKWSMFPGTLGMWVAEMDYGVADEIAESIAAQARDGLLGYLPPAETKEILESTSACIERLCGWKPDAGRMSLLPDVLTGFRLAISEFSPPGSAVVVPTPAYMPFLSIPKQMGRDVVEVPSILGDDGLWRLDFEAIETAFAGGAGLFVLCNPWNPAGRSMTRLELARLAGLVEKHDVRVFEDGIHFPLMLPGAEAVPFATVSDGAAARTITAVAASKGWNVPGLKCAQLVIHSDADWEVFEKAGSAYAGATSTLGARVARIAYDKAGAWNEAVRAYIAEVRDMVEERIAGWDGVRMAHTEATYIGFVDFSGVAATGVFGELSPAVWLRENAGVALTDGRLCGEGYEKWARIVFASSKAVVAEALDKMEHALGH